MVLGRRQYALVAAVSFALVLGATPRAAQPLYKSIDAPNATLTTAQGINPRGDVVGWFDAALDNAPGLSTMLTLAEHFAPIPTEKRRRNMIFIGTAGHHVGSPNAIYLRDKRPELLAKTELMINCEHVAVSQTLNWDQKLRRSTAVWPRRWNVNGSAKLTDLVLASYKTFGVGVVGDMDPTATIKATRPRIDPPVTRYRPACVRVDSSGRWNVVSGSLLTSSMIFAYARVDASRPVHGTVCGVSRSVWK